VRDFRYVPYITPEATFERPPGASRGASRRCLGLGDGRGPPVARGWSYSSSSSKTPGTPRVASFRPAPNVRRHGPGGARAVGAICRVDSFRWPLRGSNPFPAASSGTLVSSTVPPPCSAIFFELPE